MPLAPVVTLRQFASGSSKRFAFQLAERRCISPSLSEKVRQKHPEPCRVDRTFGCQMENSKSGKSQENFRPERTLFRPDHSASSPHRRVWHKDRSCPQHRLSRLTKLSPSPGTKSYRYAVANYQSQWLSDEARRSPRFHSAKKWIHEHNATALHNWGTDHLHRLRTTVARDQPCE